MDYVVTSNADRVTAMSLLRRSGRIWLRHYPLFTLLGSLAIIPGFVLRESSLVPVPKPGQVDLLVGLSTALGSVVAAAVAHGVLTELLGKPLVFGESLRIGVRSLGYALGAAVLFAAVALLGSFAYQLPSVILEVLFFLAVPVLVLERRGFVASFARAYKLAEGYRWTLVGAMVLIVVATTLGGGAVSLAYRHGRAWTPELRADAHRIFFVAALVVGGWWPVFTNVAFHDLRRVKEGVNIATLTDVFA